ncbi:NADPH-quinone reductase [Flavobacterium sp. Leaf82]|uniref:NADP-dependent oxidoreductase n=1 Tax=unclassified Flavobacterium TaxID=196869 RepID=UPI0007020933|nr:NADP-dependent oxidoreductase [Flavobacterium sp. Leaf82]KQO28656.1 NADPH-quinone reductase [Flavobacterium sp. Leaf82]
MTSLEKKANPIETPSKMMAIRLHEFGGTEVLRYEEAPVPKLKSGEVLIRVHAIGVNPPDWYLRDGYKMLPPEWRPQVPFPIILGSDVSGIVVAVAQDVTDFSAGDEVFGMVRFPSVGESAAYAQYVAAPATDLALKPSGLDHIHAAASAMAGLTAWQFLIELGHNHPNPLQAEMHQPLPLKDKTILINGAAGGVGHFAVQLAKWKGANVTAVASTTHESFLRDLGANHFIDYTKTPPEDVAHNIDIVLDTLGGANTGRFLKTIKPGGALFPVFLGFSDHDEAAKLDITVSMTQVRSNGLQLFELAKLLEAGTIKVAIDSTFTLSDAKSAHERAANGHIQGKIVLIVD